MSASSAGASPASRPHPSNSPPISQIHAFLRDPQFKFSLAVFDTRRGHKEGEEYEKVLSFFPTSAALTIRTAIVGLAQAVASFSSSFSETDSDVKHMDTEHNKWCMVQCEPGVWLLMVLNRSWCGPCCSNEAVLGLLRSVYCLFVLLHGSMGRTLEQDPSGFALRRVLQPYIDEAGSRLQHAGSVDAAMLSNPLAMHRGLPLLSTPRPTFLSIQCLVNQLLIASAGGTRVVAGVMLSWHGLPLWSSLPLPDGEALHWLACRALLPAAGIIKDKRWRSGRGPAALLSASPLLDTLNASETLACPAQWGLVAAHTVAAAAAAAATSTSTLAWHPGASPGTPGPHTAATQAPPGSLAAAGPGPGPASSSSASSPAHRLQPTTPHLQPGSTPGSTPPPAAGYLVPRLRQPAAARDAHHGHDPGPLMMLQQQQQQQPVLPSARVWLKTSQEHCLLLPFYDGPLLVLLLLHDAPAASPDALVAVHEVLGRQCPPLVTALRSAVPSKAVWHHRGYRYRLTDDVLAVTRASPAKKVATLSSSTARLVSHVANKLDYWAAADAFHANRSGGPGSSSGSTSSTPHGPAGAQGGGRGSSEVPGSPSAPLPGAAWSGSAGSVQLACRGFAEGAGWVMAKQGGGRRLLVAAEGLKDPGLPGAAAHLDKLCASALPGMFL